MLAGYYCSAICIKARDKKDIVVLNAEQLHHVHEIISLTSFEDGKNTAPHAAATGVKKTHNSQYKMKLVRKIGIF